MTSLLSPQGTLRV